MLNASSTPSFVRASAQLKEKSTMEQGDLDLLKDIPGFKAILRAIIKSQMKHLVEQLSKHGGEETVLLTASLAEGSFCNLGSSKAEGFLDGKDEIKSQFLGYCLKSAQKQAQDQDIEKTGDPNTESGSSKNFLSSTTKTQCVGASVLVTEAKNNEKTQEEALPQTKRSEAGSADQEHRRGRPSKKRASVTIIHEKQAKRAALPKTVTPPQKTDRTNREKSHGVSVGSGDTTIIIDAVKVENHSANASLNKDENTDHIINLIPLLTEPLGTSEDKYDTNTEQAGETEWKNKSLDSDEDIPLEIKVEPADDDEIVEIEESTSQFGFDSAAAEGEDTASAGGENTAAASRSGGRPRKRRPRQRMARKSYPAYFKLEVVKYAEEHGNYAGERHFKLSEANIRKWRKAKDQLTALENQNKKKCRDAVPKWTLLEDIMKSFIAEEDGAGVVLTNIMLLEKARQIAESLNIPDFRASHGWLQNFKRRTGCLR